MGTAEVTQFLTHLAEGAGISYYPKSSHECDCFSLSSCLTARISGNQCCPCQANASGRASPTRYLPTVLTPEEVHQILQQLHGVHKLVIQLLYGSGLRLSEGLQLRVKDVDFVQRQLVVHNTEVTLQGRW